MLDTTTHTPSITDHDALWDWDLSQINGSSQYIPFIAEQLARSGLTLPEEDFDAICQYFTRYLQSPLNDFVYQQRVIDHTGVERLMLFRGKIVVRDAQQHPKRIIGSQTDITERKHTQLILQRERDTRLLISDFAVDLMSSAANNFDAAIYRVLERCGLYLQADRTYIFLVSTDNKTISNTHEWCAKGVEPQIKHLQNIAFNDILLWKQQFRQHGYILIPSVSTMPATQKKMQQAFAAQGIQSLCTYPLYIADKLIGFIGNDSITREHSWGQDAIDFLGLVSHLMSIAIKHHRLEQQREYVINQLERAEKHAQLGRWHANYNTNQVRWSYEMMRILGCDPNTFTPTITSYLSFLQPDDQAHLVRSYENAKQASVELYFEHRLAGDGLNQDQTPAKYVEIRGRFDPISNTAEGTIQDVTNKVEQRNALQRLAFTDPLTNLPNLHSFEATLTQHIAAHTAKEQRLIVALLDIDDFRTINDQYGDHIGDSVLNTLAQRMQQLLTDTRVARVGGDEFAVLLPLLNNEDSDSKRLNRILSVLNTPIIIDDLKIVLSASMGFTEFPQPAYISGEQLLRQAQQALFQAKLSGKGCSQRYDIDSEYDTRALTQQLEVISQALKAQEFVLYYQPKVHMKTGVVFGVEALIRWQKTNGVMIAPGDFLPVLANQPLEIELGDWVIHAALTQLHKWQQQGLKTQVSVNVSGSQLFDPTFVEKLSHELQQFPDIDPASLQLEVLESSALNDLNKISKVMQSARKLGISFAIDDFGTGYSSLTYLKHLPASVLKIDQSFVRGMMENSDDLAIISGVIGMAKAFGLQVLAEGVESIEHGNLLLKLGCEQGQGFGIARPMPAAQCFTWIKEWQPVPSWLQKQPIAASNLPLLYASVEHRRWVNDLKKYLLNEITRAPLLDHNECRLGMWINNNANSTLVNNPTFARIDSIHKEFHTLGRQAISLHAQGHTQQALMLMQDIQQQRDLFLDKLKAMINKKQYT